MKLHDDELLVTDDEGKEYRFKILFTYENEERKTKYIFFYDPSDEDEVMFARYFDDGHLEYIEDEEEIAEVEEVFAAYNENDDFEVDEEEK
jgi:uncharacterized protein YrzB (UPF0473 family)